MGKNYKGTIGTDIVVNVGCDISGADITGELWVVKPSGAKVIWSAIVYNDRYLKHIVEAGDWDEEGVYNLQSYIVIGNPVEWSGPGDLTSFEIYEPINP